MTSPGERLRAALAANKPLLLPGVFNALAARMAQAIGYHAVYVSGGALSAGWAGLPDVGLLDLSEFVQEATVIARSTSLPVVCDADTGFGDTANVARAVARFEAAGIAAIHLEDQALPKRCGHLSGKDLVDIPTMVRKIRAALSARSDLLIIARTDARNVEGFDAAVDRALAYYDAGADLIFPEALESSDEFARFAQRVPAPLLANMTEFGRSPLLDAPTLARLGYAAILYPLTAFRAAMRAAEQALIHLHTHGSQMDLIPSMLTRMRLYDLIDYQAYEDRDRAYFEPPSHSPPKA